MPLLMPPTSRTCSVAPGVPRAPADRGTQLGAAPKL
jgi:hypothetical protein